MSFSEQDKRFFIKICKETLKAYLLNETIPAYTRVKSIYKEKYGVFIKLIKVRTDNGSVLKVLYLFF